MGNCPVHADGRQSRHDTGRRAAGSAERGDSDASTARRLSPRRHCSATARWLTTSTPILSPRRCPKSSRFTCRANGTVCSRAGAGAHTGNPLSRKTVRNTAGLVSSAYTRGMRWVIAEVNPVQASEPPAAHVAANCRACNGRTCRRTNSISATPCCRSGSRSS
jgi:hypothetical protein